MVDIGFRSLVAVVSRTSGALIPAGAKLKIQIECRPDRLCILTYLGPMDRL